MELKTLERLEEDASSPWRATKAVIQGNSWDVQCPDQLGHHILQTKTEADLAVTLRNLAPELIALWQSVSVLCNPPADLPATCLTQLTVVRENLDWLNSKLADL